MNFDILKKCTEERIEDLSKLDSDLIEGFFDELENNLLYQEGLQEGRIDLIKRYINKFATAKLCNGFITYDEAYNQIFIKSKSKGKTVNFYTAKDYKLNPEETCIIRYIEFINTIFQLIQLSCLEYDINLIELCNKAGFPLEHIDCSMTIEHFRLTEQKTEILKEGTKIVQPKQKTKPIFKSGFIVKIFDILKDFFDKEDHTKLNQILETGGDVGKPLIFLGSGKRLANVFKQLIKSGIITGCTQKELENWIFVNFNYIYLKKNKLFTLSYLNAIISTNSDLVYCSNPILKVTKEETTGKRSIIKA